MAAKAAGLHAIDNAFLTLIRRDTSAEDQRAHRGRPAREGRGLGGPRHGRHLGDPPPAGRDLQRRLHPDARRRSTRRGTSLDVLPRAGRRARSYDPSYGKFHDEATIKGLLMQLAKGVQARHGRAGLPRGHGATLGRGVGLRHPRDDAPRSVGDAASCPRWSARGRRSRSGALGRRIADGGRRRHVRLPPPRARGDRGGARGPRAHGGAPPGQGDVGGDRDGGPVLGLHLGMAGRIVVDGEPAPRDWDRFTISSRTAGGSRCATSAGSAAPCSSPSSSGSGPTPPR